MPFDENFDTGAGGNTWDSSGATPPTADQMKYATTVPISGGLQATPVKHPAALAVGRAAQGAQQFLSTPFGYQNPPGQMLGELLGLPAVGKTFERVAYGEPLTTGAGGLGGTTRPRDETIDAAVALAPVVPLAAKTGRALGKGLTALEGSGAGPAANAQLESILSKVKHIDELGPAEFPSHIPRPLPTKKDVVGYHVTQDVLAPLKEGLLTNRGVGDRNLQGYPPKHVGGAYFWSHPQLARAQRERFFEMDPDFPAHEGPIMKFRVNENEHGLVPDEDTSAARWRDSFTGGSFASKNPVSLKNLEAIYSGDPEITKTQIRKALTDLSGQRGAVRIPGLNSIVTNAAAPQGNLNFRPRIAADKIKGPENQKLGDLLKQVQALPGVTKEGFQELTSKLGDIDKGATVSKNWLESQLTPSQYSKVDLKNAAYSASAHLEGVAENMVIDDPLIVLERVADRIGINRSSAILRDIEMFLEGDKDLNEINPVLKSALEKMNITDADASPLEELFKEEKISAVNDILGDLIEDGGINVPLGSYPYVEYQRLMKNDAADKNYFEIGLSHPDQRQIYKHYPNYDRVQDGLAAHIRGTFVPKDAPQGAGDLVGGVTAEPNSMIIEEIQSDIQKNKIEKVELPAYLHQIHGTAFKAAIQHALENGADKVYLPSAKIIADVRQKKPDDFASIYDQQIIKEGLNPLKDIPGVSVEKEGDYYKISFTPEARTYILGGLGQASPGMGRGYKDGGTVTAPQEETPVLMDWERMRLERYMAEHPEFHAPSKDYDEIPYTHVNPEVQQPKPSTFDALQKTPFDEDNWALKNYLRKHHGQTFAHGGGVKTDQTYNVDQMRYALLRNR